MHQTGEHTAGQDQQRGPDRIGPLGGHGGTGRSHEHDLVRRGGHPEGVAEQGGQGGDHGDHDGGQPRVTAGPDAEEDSRRLGRGQVDQQPEPVRVRSTAAEQATEPAQARGQPGGQVAGEQTDDRRYDDADDRAQRDRPLRGCRAQVEQQGEPAATTWVVEAAWG